MSDRRAFIDTDIFVYAKLEHKQNKVKKRYAGHFLESLNGQIIISTQVLNEFSNVLIRHKIDDIWLWRRCGKRRIWIDRILDARSVEEVFRRSS